MDDEVICDPFNMIDIYGRAITLEEEVGTAGRLVLVDYQGVPILCDTHFLDLGRGDARSEEMVKVVRQNVDNKCVGFPLPYDRPHKWIPSGRMIPREAKSQMVPLFGLAYMKSLMDTGCSSSWGVLTNGDRLFAVQSDYYCYFRGHCPGGQYHLTEHQRGMTAYFGTDGELKGLLMLLGIDESHNPILSRLSKMTLEQFVCTIPRLTARISEDVSDFVVAMGTLPGFNELSWGWKHRNGYSRDEASQKHTLIGKRRVVSDTITPSMLGGGR